MILKAEMQTVGDKTVISCLRWYVSDRYRLLITVSGVGGDFSQTDPATFQGSVTAAVG